MPEDKCCECGKHLGYGDPAFHLGICEECDVEDEPEPVILQMPPVEDDGPEEDDLEIPELTPEILLKMFANMQANGL